MVIGIDVGRAATKVIREGCVWQFPSQVGEWRELRLDSGQLDYEVEVDGDRWWVGHAADESHYRRRNAEESKIHQETKVLFLAALALALPETVDRLTVTTGLPVYQHDAATKRAMQDLLVGEHRVTVNGRSVKIDLPRVIVVPEGAGAFWAIAANDAAELVRQDLMDLRQRCRIIDVGSRTVNYVTLMGGRYLDRESGTLPYGWLEVETAAEAGADDARGFAARVAADLSRRWASLRASDVVLLAGGAAPAVAPHLPYTVRQVIPEPALANVRGYRRLGLFYDKARRD